MDNAKVEEVKSKMDSMKDTLNEQLDKDVAEGKITEHEARERYFMMMSLTMMLAS